MYTEFEITNESGDYIIFKTYISSESYRSVDYYSIRYDFESSNKIEDSLTNWDIKKDEIIDYYINHNKKFKNIILNYIKKGESIFERSKRYAHIYGILVHIEETQNLNLLRVKNYITDNYEINNKYLEYDNIIGNLDIDLKHFDNLIIKNTLTEELVKYLTFDLNTLVIHTGVTTPIQYKIKILSSLAQFAE